MAAPVQPVGVIVAPHDDGCLGAFGKLGFYGGDFALYQVGFTIFLAIGFRLSRRLNTVLVFVVRWLMPLGILRCTSATRIEGCR